MRGAARPAADAVAVGGDVCAGVSSHGQPFEQRDVPGGGGFEATAGSDRLWAGAEPGFPEPAPAGVAPKEDAAAGGGARGRLAVLGVVVPVHASERGPWVPGEAGVGSAGGALPGGRV